MALSYRRLHVRTSPGKPHAASRTSAKQAEEDERVYESTWIQQGFSSSLTVQQISGRILKYLNLRKKSANVAIDILGNRGKTVEVAKSQ